jgi:TetR/AcrR family fatty acid metabolism transcriptional regulator
MPNSNNKTRRERLEEREDAIVAAAHDEFVTKGFDGARIAGIARRAGVAEGTLYLYFKNKSALLGAVVGAFYERLTAGAAEGVALRQTTGDRLAFLARHHLTSCLQEWAILALAMPALYQASNYRNSEYFGFNRKYVAVFDSVVREGIARGEIRNDLPLHLMRDLFYGALEHSVRTIMVRESAQPGSQDATSLSDQVMAMVRPAFGLAGLHAEAAPEPDLLTITRRLEAAVCRLERSDAPLSPNAGG